MRLIISGSFGVSSDSPVLRNGGAMRILLAILGGYIIGWECAGRIEGKWTSFVAAMVLVGIWAALVVFLPWDF